MNEISASIVLELSDPLQIWDTVLPYQALFDAKTATRSTILARLEGVAFGIDWVILNSICSRRTYPQHRELNEGYLIGLETACKPASDRLRTRSASPAYRLHSTEFSAA